MFISIGNNITMDATTFGARLQSTKFMAALTYGRMDEFFPQDVNKSDMI